MKDHNFSDLQSYIDFLDRIGDLKTIETEVDPELEITEISCKTIEQDGPALLFKNVKGSKYPVVTNLFGTKDRMNLSLGCNPKELGEQILNFAQKSLPPKLSNIFDSNVFPNLQSFIFLNKPPLISHSILFSFNALKLFDDKII